MVGHYLMFNRNCAEALEQYSKAFNVKVLMTQKYGDMPPNPAFPVTEEDKNLILHAKMKIGDVEIMCADSSAHIDSGGNMYITITSKDKPYIETAWDVLKQDGQVFMEMQPSFFALLHGSLKDKYGVNWMFTVSK